MPFETARSFLTRACTALAVAAPTLIVPALKAHAQPGRTEAVETRAALTQRADLAEKTGQRAYAANIRARLAEGDLQEGDKVVIVFENMPNFGSAAGRTDAAAAAVRPDTLLVRTGRVLQFPQVRYQGVKDLKVAGLLRSELPDAVTKQFAVIYKEPQLRVIPLVSLLVNGAVGRAGYIDVPPDIKLNDVFTLAGGLATDANMKKANVFRGTQEIMRPADLQQALDNGLTVDAAQLRAGDQISVPRKNPNNWLAYAGVLMSVVTLVVAVSRGR